jgi:peptidoglycan hydrolase-like protein with peptidoglycan-binding domain
LIPLNTLALPPIRRGLAVPIALALLGAVVAGTVWLVGRSSDRTALRAPTATIASPQDQPVARALTPSITADTTPDLQTLPTTAPPTTAPPTTEAPPTTQPPGPTPAEIAATKDLQNRLEALGYSPGPIDGRFGGRTSSAVLAFEKVEGLPLDGDAGPEVLARLNAPQGHAATEGSAVPRLEIDLQRQVIAVVTSGGTRVFNTSTGNNEPFTWPDGTRAKAYTPTGHFKVLRRVEGVDDGPLGALYRPLYFYDGWAVHGSGFVPAYPASHGCARVSFADQDWIWDNVPNGIPVIVY